MAQESSPVAVSPAVDSASDSGSSAPTEGDATWEPDMDTNETPPPTRRGRSTKVAVDTNKPPAKRGRGRPRKNPDAPPKPAKDPDAPKRGRGRPRKNPPSEPVEKRKPKATTAASDGVKRGRGRPRKHPVPEANTSDVEDPSFEPGSNPTPAKEREGDEGEPAAPVAKRKRGRPKKTESQAPSTITKQPKTQPPETTETQIEPPAKKRRGRPKKTEQKPKRPSDPPDDPETPAKSESSDFHLEVPVSFEESSSDGEVGENIASLVSRNGILQDQQDQQQAAESSDSSYTTPDP